VSSSVPHIEENAVLARIFARLPHGLQHSFTPEQVSALGMATYEAPAPHKVAIRRTFNVFGRRYYFAMFSGRDRRSSRHDFAAIPADEFRADWRYALMILFLTGAAMAVIVGGAMLFWSSVSEFIGGERSVPPPARSEFFIGR
jgi:hypothetical protein